MARGFGVVVAIVVFLFPFPPFTKKFLQLTAATRSVQSLYDDLQGPHLLSWMLAALGATVWIYLIDP